MDNRHGAMDNDVDSLWTALLPTAMPTSYPRLRNRPVTHKPHSCDYCDFSVFFFFFLKIA